MSDTTAIPEAYDRIKAAIDAGVLKDGQWGDGTTAVCMMSAAVVGATSVKDCVTAGWPLWLAELNVYLFDASVGADDEVAARAHFALDVAKAVSAPRDMNKAHDLFVVAALEGLPEFSDEVGKSVSDVIALYKRRLCGDAPTEEEWATAQDAARDAAWAAADAAAPDAARAAARDAAWDAAAPDVARAAAWDAAWAAAPDVAWAAARAAADAAARKNLIAALEAS